MLLTLDDVREVSFPNRSNEIGDLGVYQSPDAVPFPIRRVFCVRSKDNNAERGNHAHKACWQLLIPLNGAIHLSCTDGQDNRSFVLDDMYRGVLVPPTIWASQIYETAGSTLMVLTDLPYDESDYIRKFEDFLTFRKLTSPS